VVVLVFFSEREREREREKERVETEEEEEEEEERKGRICAFCVKIETGIRIVRKWLYKSRGRRRVEQGTKLLSL
jgi:hypothetical protein